MTAAWEPFENVDLCACMHCTHARMGPMGKYGLRVRVQILEEAFCSETRSPEVGLSAVQRVPLPNIPFSSNAFFELTRAKSRAKSPIAQKALLEKIMFGSGTRGIFTRRFEVIITT